VLRQERGDSGVHVLNGAGHLRINRSAIFGVEAEVVHHAAARYAALAAAYPPSA